MIVFSQGFDRRDEDKRADFFMTMQFSKGFHTKENMNCKNLSSEFATWQYEDTLHLNFHELHVFFHDGKADSIKLDTVFTKRDQDYMRRQFNYYRNNRQQWKDCYAWRIVKVKTEGKWKIPYWEISQPLYSIDFTKCLVKMNYFKKETDYVLCLFLFYKNKKGEWVEKAVINAEGPGE